MLGYGAADEPPVSNTKSAAFRRVVPCGAPPFEYFRRQCRQCKRRKHLDQMKTVFAPAGDGGILGSIELPEELPNRCVGGE